MKTRYRRIQHAAHYAYGAVHPKYGQGHDLDEWAYPQGERLLVPAEIPGDAEYHCGFVNNGQQWWVYVRRAPMTGTCADCKRKEVRK